MGTTQGSDSPTDSQGVCPLLGTRCIWPPYRGPLWTGLETLLSSVLPDGLLPTLCTTFLCPRQPWHPLCLCTWPLVYSVLSGCPHSPWLRAGRELELQLLRDKRLADGAAMLGVSSETQNFISLTGRMSSVPGAHRLKVGFGRRGTGAPAPDCCRNKVTRRISGHVGLHSNDASATCWVCDL